MKKFFRSKVVRFDRETKKETFGKGIELRFEKMVLLSKRHKTGNGKRAR